MYHTENTVIYFGSSITPTQKECYKSNTSDKLQIDILSDGESVPIFRESVRKKDLYIIQSLNKGNMMETLSIIDAAKRSGASSINLVTPYLPYSRQDKKGKLRTSITAKVVADILQKTGLSTIMTIDLHASAIEGFYDIPLIHVDPKDLYIPIIEEHYISKGFNPIIVAPDQGATERATSVAKELGLDMATIIKARSKPNDMSHIEMTLKGNVEDRLVIVIDDIADTCGTLMKAAGLLKENGAKGITAMMTHGVLSGPAIDRLKKGILCPDGIYQDIRLFVSDSVENVESKSALFPHLKLIDCHNLLYRTICNITDIRYTNKV
jgi:ribose-phosphate pyrophosphokinase